MEVVLEGVRLHAAPTPLDLQVYHVRAAHLWPWGGRRPRWRDVHFARVRPHKPGFPAPAPRLLRSALLPGYEPLVRAGRAPLAPEEDRPAVAGPLRTVLARPLLTPGCETSASRAPSRTTRPPTSATT